MEGVFPNSPRQIVVAIDERGTAEHRSRPGEVRIGPLRVQGGRGENSREYNTEVAAASRRAEGSATSSNRRYVSVVA